jgi:hypothetical protein
LSYVEQTAIDDEGMVVALPDKRCLFCLVEYLAVDGKFRFARDHRIVQKEVIEAFSDGKRPKVPFLGRFDMSAHIDHFKLECPHPALTHI